MSLPLLSVRVPQESLLMPKPKQGKVNNGWGHLVAVLPWLFLLARGNSPKHAIGHFDVLPVPLRFLIFVIWLVILVLHVRVVGGGVGRGRRGGWHGLGAWVSETLCLWQNTLF